LKKASVLVLIVISLLLLWWDRKQDREKGERTAAAIVPSPVVGVD
jgi:hypothetical protein